MGLEPVPWRPRPGPLPSPSWGTPKSALRYTAGFSEGQGDERNEALGAVVAGRCMRGHREEVHFHLVHRSNGTTDGAIVIDPEGSPTLLAFHFVDQVF